MLSSFGCDESFEHTKAGYVAQSYAAGQGSGLTPMSGMIWPEVGAIPGCFPDRSGPSVVISMPFAVLAVQVLHGC